MISQAVYKKYRPEIVASAILVIYTIIRTVLVAGGISPVSQVSWQVFLAIELITTAPYVWALGDVVRSSVKGRKQSLTRRALAISIAILCFAAPYAYLVVYGAAQTEQGFVVLIFMLLVFALPSAIRLYLKLKKAYSTRSNRNK